MTSQLRSAVRTDRCGHTSDYPPVTHSQQLCSSSQRGWRHFRHQKASASCCSSGTQIPGNPVLPSTHPSWPAGTPPGVSDSSTDTPGQSRDHLGWKRPQRLPPILSPTPPFNWKSPPRSSPTPPQHCQGHDWPCPQVPHPQGFEIPPGMGAAPTALGSFVPMLDNPFSYRNSTGNLHLSTGMDLEPEHRTSHSHQTNLETLLADPA